MVITEKKSIGPGESNIDLTIILLKSMLCSQFCSFSRISSFDEFEWGIECLTIYHNWNLERSKSVRVTYAYCKHDTIWLLVKKFTFQGYTLSTNNKSWKGDRFTNDSKLKPEFLYADKNSHISSFGHRIRSMTLIWRVTTMVGQKQYYKKCYKNGKEIWYHDTTSE